MKTSESETTENKLSLAEREEIVESVAAFATASGGTIRIGVNNDGVRIGVQIGNRTLECIHRRRVATGGGRLPLTGWTPLAVSQG